MGVLCHFSTSVFSYTYGEKLCRSKVKCFMEVRSLCGRTFLFLSLLRRKKMKKLSLALVLLLVSLLVIVLLCGCKRNRSDFYYTIENGEVTITAYRGKGGEVIIPTHIEDLPVTKIGERAFKDNQAITHVIIEGYVGNRDRVFHEIGDYAFSNCYQLQAVYLPKTIKRIGERAFANTRSLTKSYYCHVTTSFDDSTGEINATSEYILKDTTLNMLQDCDQLESIGDYAFYNSGLTELDTFWDISIGKYAFADCKNLSGGLSIINYIDDDNRAEGAKFIIDDHAFSSTKLEDISLIGIDYIGVQAFSPVSLKTVRLKDIGHINGSFYNGFDTSVEKVILYDDVSVLWQMTGYIGWMEGRLYNYNEVPIEGSLSDLYNQCPEVDGVRYGFNETKKEAYVLPQVHNDTTELVIRESVYHNGEEYPVTKIHPYAFWDCSQIVSVTIPDSISTLPDGLFTNGCPNLKSVIIGNGLTKIGDNAFNNCDSLTSVTIGSGVTSIGEYAFYGCTSLASIIIPNSVTSIGDSAFYCCAGLTSIIIPDSVTSIGDSAFNCCAGLTSIMIPNSVTSIGDSAFSDCTGLTSIVIPDSVTSIGYQVFSLCTGLTSIVIPDSVTSIGEYAFYDCTSLTSIVIPDSVTSIGDSAFSGCTGLTSIVIPYSVTSIGRDAFEDCNSITIYCEAEKKPRSWDNEWNRKYRPMAGQSQYCPVVWGYKG